MEVLKVEREIWIREWSAPLQLTDKFE